MNSAKAVLEDNLFRIEIDRTNGAFAMIDKSCGEKWDIDPWMQSAGILTLENEKGARLELDLSRSANINVNTLSDSSVALTFSRPSSASGEKPDAEVKTRLSLVGNGFRVEILDVTFPSSWSFVDLEYPSRLGALKTDVDTGYLVIPYWHGSIVPCTTGTFDQIPRVPFWAWDDMPWRDAGAVDLPNYEWNGLNMPFFGAVKGKSAWMGIFETENDSGIRCLLNNNLQQKYDKVGKVTPFPQRLAVSSPVWRSERGKFSYARSMTYYMLPSGDYVDLAKRYKIEVTKKGLGATLKEKIQNNPNIETIIGAPLVNINGGYPWYIDNPAFRYTWSNVREIIDDMSKTVGLERALVCLWIGYENYPPDSYPFHPANGTVEELQNLVKYGKERDYLICFYHGYPALLDHAPNFDVKRARQLTPRGEIASRWGRHCSHYFLEYAKKNLPASIKDSGQVADYTDMLTAGAIAECWAAGHDMTRTQDRENKVELLKYINSLGLFTGSECPRGWAIPYSAYTKNAGVGGSNPILNCYMVPLFNLVFKDCAVMYRERQAVADASMFSDLANGNHIQIHMTWPGYKSNCEGFKDVVKLFQRFTRATGKEELLSHRFTEELNGPYVTRFSDGSCVRVNPTNGSREIDGEQMEAGMLAITDSSGEKTRVSSTAAAYSFRK